MIDVLYVGAANLAQPTSGTDTASLCHFNELWEDQQLAVSAVSVCSSLFNVAVPARQPAQLFTSDIVTPKGARHRALQKLALLARGGILFQSGFVSDAARTKIRFRLAQAPDALLIDHITALANISLFQLLKLRLRRRTKIIVVAHDVSSVLLRDRAKMHPSKLKALAIYLHAMHCYLYENAVFTLAHRVVFLSTSDRVGFRFVRAAKTDAMCPIIELSPVIPDAAQEEMFGKYLVFVGSPSFFPNTFAIEWIIRRLAPQLLLLMPQLTILLIGKGTDRSDDGRPANVIGLGFVDDDRLHRLLRGSCGSLSPVIHGSGIKIKVLEAIASGCAIFATEQSLRGYEFMQIDPLLDADDPGVSASQICAIVGDPARLDAFKQRIDARWQDYTRTRRGKLAELVKHLVVTPSDAMSRHSSEPVAH